MVMESKGNYFKARSNCIFKKAINLVAHATNIVTWKAVKVISHSVFFPASFRNLSEYYTLAPSFCCPR